MKIQTLFLLSTLVLAPFARAANIATITVRRMIRRGEIRCVRLGRSIRIPASELVRISTPTNAAPAR